MVRQVQKMEQKELKKCQRRLRATLKNETFEEVANGWFSGVRENVKISTAGVYNRLLKNHLLPYFGKMEYRDITPEIVKGFITSERKRDSTTAMFLMPLRCCG